MISSVISSNHPGHATIDAGTKAVYVTPGAPPRVIDGNVFRPNVAYAWNYGDEHGHLPFPENVTMTPGERIELKMLPSAAHPV